MESFWVSFNAVAPLLLMVSLGYYLKEKNLLSGETLTKSNYLCFHLYLPVLLYSNIIHSDVSNLLDFHLFVFVTVAVLVIFAMVAFIVPIFEKDASSKGAIIQGLFRTNYVILGIPLSNAIYGNDGGAIASMVITLVIPLYNILAVFILATYGSGSKKIGDVAFKIIKNPLILASLCAILTLMSPFQIPKFLDSTISSIAKIGASLPIILLGAGLDIKQMKANTKKLAIIVISRLILIPAVAMIICILFEFRGAELTVLLTVFATPSAISSAIMAEQMQCNGELAGEIVVTTSVFSFLSIFMWVFLLNFFGYM